MRTSVAAASCLWATLFPAIALAQTIAKVGVEFQAHTFTEGSQVRGRVAMDAQGDFVVVWEYNPDFAGYDVFARRFDSAGVAQAAAFQVNAWTLNTQRRSTLAMENDGDFLVAWESSPSQDGYGRGIFARRFDSAGLAKGQEFQVNAYTAGHEEYPRAALDADGDFVVAWTTPEIAVRRFNAAGIAQAVELQVNSHTVDVQRAQDVAMSSTGAFVVIWQSFGQDNDGWGVFARRFDSAGAPQATEFQASLYTRFDQRYPSVAVDTDGDFVVVWQSDGYSPGYPDVFARLFTASGVAQAPFQVNDKASIVGPAAVQGHPDVAMEGGGAFVVSWESLGQDGDSIGVFARRFDAGGTARTAEVQVNSYTTGQQNAITVAINGNGEFVIAWTSFLQDGSMGGAFAQRFETLDVLDIDGDGNFLPLTDGLLMLRYAFGFTGSTLTTGAVSAGCTRCNAASIEAYLDSLN